MPGRQAGPGRRRLRPWQLLAFAVCADRTTGYTVRASLSGTDGTEPRKQARIDCPIVRDPLTHNFVRMRIVNAGGAVTNVAPGNVTLTEVYPFSGKVIVTRRENTPTSADWVVQAQAVCAL